MIFKKIQTGALANQFCELAVGGFQFLNSPIRQNYATYGYSYPSGYTRRDPTIRGSLPRTIYGAPNVLEWMTL
jgi:hypothetical protein